MKRKVLQIVLMVAILLMGVSTFAAPRIRVVVNGERVIFPDAQPYMDENNRVLIPVRFVSEELGAKVDWYPETKKVVIADRQTIVTLKIGEKQMTVNNTVKQLDTKATIKDTRTFVPLRFVSEALGAVVEWDGKGNSVYISSNGQPIIKDEVLSHEGFGVDSKDVIKFDDDGKYGQWITTQSKFQVVFKTSESAKENNRILIAYVDWRMKDADFKKQCEELREFLSCQIEAKCVDQIMKYVILKTSYEVELPMKVFKDSYYMIEVVSQPNSEVIISVNKR